MPRGARPLRPQNFGEVKGRGLELEAEWRLAENVDLSANYAYQQTTDEESDSDLGHAPGQQLHVRVDWRWRDRWLASAALNAVADRERVPGDARPAIDDYALVDLTLRRTRLAPGLDVALAVRNLFDEDAREPSQFVAGPIPAFIRDDLPLPGRNATFELRYRF